MRFVRTAENLFGLPQGFTRVEYLESSGTQYIDTGYKPVPATTKFEFYFSPTAISGNYFLFGARPDTSIGGFTCTTYFATGNIRQDWAGLGSYFTKINVGDKVLYSAYNNMVSLNNDSVTGTVVRSTDRLNYNFLLFTVNTGGTVDSRMYVGKVYYAKLWDDGTLVRDFIPCIDPLGVACMYDLVGKKPYYNQGTGTFTAGRQVIPVEYLEGTGTQYIDTGVRGFADFEIGVKLRESVSNVSIFCSNNYRLERYNATNPYWRFRNNNDFYNSGISITEYHVMAWKNDEVYADGIKLQDFSKTWNVAANMTLFGISASGSYPSMIYFCKLWNPTDGTLLRDFIPCKDENDNGFLFDKVSGTCYLNAGTGSFSVGENKYTSKLRLIKDAIRLPDGYTRVEYLESTGTQYIDTGYIPTNTTGVQVRHTICADNSKDNILFGCRENSQNTRFWEDVDWGGADNIGWGFNEYSNNVSGYRCPLTSDMIGQTIISSFNFMNDRACKVNGVSYDPSVATKTLATITRPIYLFAANNQGNAGYFNACKIFSCQISEGSTLVRSFIPVRDSNNVGYMFDEVTGQIFGNDGSGSFGIGNDLPTAKVRFIQDVLPREYRPLKYLQSTGTQYIDTGIPFVAQDDYIIKTRSVNFDTSKRAIILSNYIAYNQYSALSLEWWAGSSSYNGKARAYCVTKIGSSSGTNTTSDAALSINVSHDLELNYSRTNNSISLKWDGNTATDTLNAATLPNYSGSFCLFLDERPSLPDALKNPTRIYYLQIYHNNTLVRDFYPALRKSDNKPGMYDRITKQFFTNASESGNDFNYE